MPSIARGYGGYHDVVDSVENPLFEDQEQDWTPGLDQQAQEDESGSFNSSKQSGASPDSTASSTLEQASGILAKIPGAKTVSYANAGIFGACGAAAAFVAWLAGLTLLLVLLARAYLPSHKARHNLPLHFDYAAGPSQAMVWVPLLKPCPLADSLSPPAKPYTAASAGLRGFLTPGSSSYSRRSKISGLGFSPVSRHSSGGAADNSTTDGLWARISGRSRRRRRAAARAAAAADSSVMHDVGNGVSVPEGDWLVPLWGETQLAVELEMPGWPQADMVQVTGELFSAHGISLGRWTTTWVPKSKPLLFRVISTLALGPWRALGLVDDTSRVELPLFDSFRNPTPPPGGWASLAGYRRFIQRQQQLMESWDEFGSDAGFKGAATQQGLVDKEDEGLGRVPGPRALWLRVTLSGRSYEAGPPRVYSAKAKLDVDRGFLDRIAASLRPSLATALLVFTLGSAFMFGGAGTAAVLLYIAYVLYCWGSRISNEADRTTEQQQQQQYSPTHAYGAWNEEEFVEPNTFNGGVGGTGEAQSDEYVDGTYDETYDDDFTHHPISEEEGEEYKSESATASDESYEDPDLTAANDDMYSSPRALDADRALSPFGYADRQATRRSGDNRSGSGSGLGPACFEAAAPAAPPGTHAVLLDVPHGGQAVAEGAAAAPVTPSTASSRLWSVLGGGGAAQPQQQQQQQQQKAQRWGHRGPEDLPPSLGTAGSSGSTGTAAAATAAAAAAPAAAAGRVGSQGVGGSAVSSSQSGGNAGGSEDVYSDAVGEAAAGATAQQQEVGAAGPPDPDDWKRQLLEESDDESTAQQQQQQQGLKGGKPGSSGGAPQQQQQQQGLVGSAAGKGAAQEQGVLLTDEAAAAAAPVKRRFGFRFKS